MSEESYNSGSQASFENTKHKVELCRAFAETGLCPYGEICMFAHGVEELMMHQPVLKTKKCRNYHTDGYCRFGERCNFKHEKDAKPRKKKNLYKFHRILNSYPDIILRSMISETFKPSSFINHLESSYY